MTEPQPSKEMRVVYKFGDFRMWDKLPYDRVGQTVLLVHPMDYVDPATELTIKSMRFDYKRRLDYDLVEYEYVSEQ